MSVDVRELETDEAGRIHKFKNPDSASICHLFLRQPTSGDRVVLSEENTALPEDRDRENAWFRADATLLTEVER